MPDVTVCVGMPHVVETEPPKTYTLVINLNLSARLNETCLDCLLLGHCDCQKFCTVK